MGWGWQCTLKMGPLNLGPNQHNFSKCVVTWGRLLE